jgi:hypothetical protein
VIRHAHRRQSFMRGSANFATIDSRDCVHGRSLFRDIPRGTHRRKQKRTRTDESAPLGKSDHVKVP